MRSSHTTQTLHNVEVDSILFYSSEKQDVAACVKIDSSYFGDSQEMTCRWSLWSPVRHTDTFQSSSVHLQSDQQRCVTVSVFQLLISLYCEAGYDMIYDDMINGVRLPSMHCSGRHWPPQTAGNRKFLFFLCLSLVNLSPWMAATANQIPLPQ